MAKVLKNRDEISLRPPYWSDNTLTLAAKVFGMDKCSITYASQKMRIIYDKGWYGRHLLKAIRNMTGDVPIDSLCPLCKMPDSLRHWTSECQDNAMLTCRREILDSLPLPNGEKPLHQFTRAVSLIIPQLLNDTAEPESCGHVT